MLPLLCAMILFFWLVVGAVQFLLCVAVPRLRRYALSAALWWAVWGPCSIALMLLAGTTMIAWDWINKDGEVSRLHTPHLAIVGWGYVVLGALVTAVIATGIAWLHQAVVHRFTFALFRLYATLIVAGIGSVFGWCFCWWILTARMQYGWFLALSTFLGLVGAFGFSAYNCSRALRGDAPEKLTWVSREEFEGI